METQKSIHEMCVETRLIMQALTKLEEGETLKYTDLEKLASCNVRKGRGYGFLATAKKRVQMDHGIIIDTVLGVGIKRLSPADMPELGRKSITRIRRASTRAAKKLTTTDFSRLSREESASVLAQVSVLGFMAHCAKEKEVKKVEPLVMDRTMELPIGQTLEAFREKSAV